MIIYCSICVAVILFLFYKTDVFYEYVGFLPFDLFKVKQMKSMEYTEHYTLFLLEYYNNFFTRLISCPKCLCVWLSAAASLLTFYWALPVIYYFSLFLFYLLGKIEN